MAKTTEQKMKGIIAKIHVAKTQLALDDDNYRAILQRVAGQDSCKKCNLLQLQKIMAEMERLGFEPTRKNMGSKPLHTTDVSAMMNKLAALLANGGKSWEYANGMAKRMFNKEQVNLLNANELRRLIAALNIHLLKQQAAQAISQ